MIDLVKSFLGDIKDCRAYSAGRGVFIFQERPTFFLSQALDFEAQDIFVQEKQEEQEEPETQTQEAVSENDNQEEIIEQVDISNIQATNEEDDDEKQAQEEDYVEKTQIVEKETEKSGIQTNGMYLDIDYEEDIWSIISSFANEKPLKAFNCYNLQGAYPLWEKLACCSFISAKTKKNDENTANAFIELLGETNSTILRDYRSGNSSTIYTANLMRLSDVSSLKKAIKKQDVIESKQSDVSEDELEAFTKMVTKERQKKGKPSSGYVDVFNEAFSLLMSTKKKVKHGYNVESQTFGISQGLLDIYFNWKGENVSQNIPREVEKIDINSAKKLYKEMFFEGTGISKLNDLKTAKYLFVLVVCNGIDIASNLFKTAMNSEFETSLELNGIIGEQAINFFNGLDKDNKEIISSVILKLTEKI